MRHQRSGPVPSSPYHGVLNLVCDSFCEGTRMYRYGFGTGTGLKTLTHTRIPGGYGPVRNTRAGK